MNAADRGSSEYRYVDLAGRRLACRCAGPAGGRPVVLLHALASSSEAWGPVSAALAAHGRRVIAVDLRGHGRSSWAGDYRLESFAEDVIALLDRFALPTVDLIGHSLGGHVALRVAQMAPGRVGRVLIEEAPIPPRDGADAATIQLPVTGKRALGLLGIGRAVRIVLGGRFDIRMTRALIAALRAPMPQWWADLARIEADCLLLFGDHHPPAAHRPTMLAQAIPGARLLILGSGHHLHKQHADSFLRAALDLLLSDRRARGAEAQP